MKNIFLIAILFKTFTLQAAPVWDWKTGSWTTPKPPVVQKAPVDPIDQATKGLEKREGWLNLYVGSDDRRGQFMMEIPASELNHPMVVIMLTSHADAQRSLLHMPSGDMSFEFRMNPDGKRIDVVEPNWSARWDADGELANANELGVSNGTRMMAMMPAATREKDEEVTHYLLDVSDWINSGFGSRRGYNRDLSYVNRSDVYPTNMEFDIVFNTGSSESGTHFSVQRLPDELMTTRTSDQRIGYFDTQYYDMDVNPEQTDGGIVRLANKWRLEPKDPEAEMLEPIKPITYYVDPTVSETWRPYVAMGIEKWNKSFEAAGWKGAVKAVLPGDEDWPEDYSAGDSRYSSVSWAPSLASTFAIGPSNVDPRTGEILNADIVFTASWIKAWTGDAEVTAHPLFNLPHYEEILKIGKEGKFKDFEASLYGYGDLPEGFDMERYCAMLSPISGGNFSPVVLRNALIADGVIGADDPIPHSFITEALVEVTMHEVGHTIGLRHNFKSSHGIPWEEINNKEYTSEHGLMSSVMDYAESNVSSDRENQGHYSSPVTGDYDDWAVQYGYTHLPDEVSGVQHEWLKELASDNTHPHHHFATDQDSATAFGWDPYTNYWDLSDPLSFFEDRIKLAKSLVSDIEERVVSEGEEWTDLRGGVSQILYDMSRGGPFAAKYLGGHDMSRAHKGDPGAPAPISFISYSEQERALSLLVESLTVDTAMLVDFYPYMVNSFRSYGLGGRSFMQDLNTDIHSTVASRKMMTLMYLFDSARLVRMRDAAWYHEASGGDSLAVSDVFGAVHEALWNVDASNSFNRDSQSLWTSYLIQMGNSGPDMLALSTDALIDMHESATEMSDDSDPMVAAHMTNIAYEIRRALDL